MCVCVCYCVIMCMCVCVCVQSMPVCIYLWHVTVDRRSYQSVICVRVCLFHDNRIVCYSDSVNPYSLTVLHSPTPSA